MENKKAPKFFFPVHDEVNIPKARRIAVWTGNESKSLTKVVQGYFESDSKANLEMIEKRYPRTLRSLFYLAWQIDQGFCGEKLRLESETFFTWETVLPLLFLSISKTGMKSLQPEIFDQKLKLDEKSIKGLITTFHHFRDHLLNPSHFLIELFLKMKFKDKVLSVLEKIKNPVEKSKALSSLAEVFIERGQLNQAIQQWKLISVREERDKISHRLIEKMIEQGHPEEIKRFLSQISDAKEKNGNYQNACLLLTRANWDEEALRLAESIQDREIRDSTLSHMVHLLARQYRFEKAKTLPFLIRDAEFREDALLSIVKAYMHDKRIEEGVQFVESMSNLVEKKKLAHLIESALNEEAMG